MLLTLTELRASPIHGFGVFLLAPVKKGELVWRFQFTHRPFIFRKRGRNLFRTATPLHRNLWLLA